MKPSYYNSRFIAIEGNDGAGKASQTKALADHIEGQGLAEVETIAFPRYDQPSGRLVKEYLDNNFGPATEVHPKLASLLYTYDRQLASVDIHSAINLGKLVIADRFTGSNLAHQGAKLSDKNERRDFYKWVLRTEFEDLEIPKPEHNLVLLVSRGISRLRRKERAAQGRSLDGHEEDENYQQRVSDTFEELCQLYPDWFVPIDCMDGEQQKPAEAITRLILDKLDELL